MSGGEMGGVKIIHHGIDQQCVQIVQRLGFVLSNYSRRNRIKILIVMREE